MDLEIKAMGDIATALSKLSPDEARRVLKWANDKYLIRISSSAATDEAVDAVASVSKYADIGELVDAAKPSSGLDRILVAAYWFQVAQGQDDFDSLSLNTELKHMGYPSANITRDLDSLVNRTPKLVMQTRKEGTSKQARKRFRLTREGTRTVENMLRSESAEV